MVVDSHFHPQLLKAELQDKFHDCMIDAQKSGVSKFIAVSVNIYEDRQQLELLTQQYHDMYYTLGIHPLYVGQNINEFPIPMNEKFKGLGETGLDFKDNMSSLEKERQKENFKMHLQIAQNYNLPIVVHTRNAEKETIALIREFPGVRGVLHCFTGSLQLALDAIELGFYISFSGIITFNSNSVLDLKNTVKQIPLNRILVETDSPYLSPTPYRGKYPNTPKNVILVLDEICQLKEVPRLDTALQIENNTKHLFNLPL